MWEFEPEGGRVRGVELEGERERWAERAGGLGQEHGVREPPLVAGPVE